MLRRIAVAGDPLSTGGYILPDERTTRLRLRGHQGALVGGRAWCAACGSPGIIARAGGPRRMRYMTNEVALDQDIVLCRCPAPPVVVARLAGESWYEDETTGYGQADASAPPGQAASFDERVHATGIGFIEGYPYFIEVPDGPSLFGQLDGTGRLPRIHTDAVASYTVFWGDEALDRQTGA